MGQQRPEFNVEAHIFGSYHRFGGIGGSQGHFTGDDAQFRPDMPAHIIFHHQLVTGVFLHLVNDIVAEIIRVHQQD